MDEVRSRHDHQGPTGRPCPLLQKSRFGCSRLRHNLSATAINHLDETPHALRIDGVPCIPVDLQASTDDAGVGPRQDGFDVVRAQPARGYDQGVRDGGLDALEHVQVWEKSGVQAADDQPVDAVVDSANWALLNRTP